MKERIKRWRRSRLDRKVNRLWGEAMHAEPIEAAKATQKLCKALDAYFG